MWNRNFPAILCTSSTKCIPANALTTPHGSGALLQTASWGKGVSAALMGKAEAFDDGNVKPLAAFVMFSPFQENFHIWELEDKHGLCHAGTNCYVR